jgi:uncharacterized protein
MKAAIARLAFVLPLLLAPLAAGAQPAEAVPTEAQISAALDLLAATHAVDTFNTRLDALVPLETAQIKRAAPSLNDSQVALIEKRLRDAITARQSELLRIQAIEYARHFDEKELHDLAAFYRSDLGQKYIAAAPALAQEIAPVVQKWMQNVAGEAVQDLLKSLPNTQNKKL